MTPQRGPSPQRAELPRGWRERWRGTVPWPWALGSVAAVCLVLAATLLTHAAVEHARSEAYTVPAPSTPLLQVDAITRPEGGARLVALDANAGVVDVLAAPVSSQGGEGTVLPAPQGCPPAIHGCLPAAIEPAASTFLVLDDVTGATRARVPLAGSCAAARDATTLLEDPTHGRTYALDAATLVMLDTRSGACLGAVRLPGATNSTSDGASLSGALIGAALTPDSGGLYLAYAHALFLVDPANGHLLRGGALAPQEGSLVAGPVLDLTSNAVFTLERTSAETSLVAFAADTLTPMRSVDLPAGARLGPLLPDTRALVLYSATGTITLRDTATLLRQPPSSGGAPKPLTHLGGLPNTLALGWERSSETVLAAGTRGLQLYGVTGTARHLVAALPLPLATVPGWEPLLVDSARQESILPVGDGSLVFVRNVATRTIDQHAALLFARAALARYLPDTNQQPPFLDATTFPLAPGSAPRAYYIHFSDLGWQGPYPGSASTRVASVPGASGAFQVTYGIAWNQLFPRQHSWVAQVERDGSVRLLSSSGDAVP